MCMNSIQKAKASFLNLILNFILLNVVINSSHVLKPHSASSFHSISYLYRRRRRGEKTFFFFFFNYDVWQINLFLSLEATRVQVLF